MLIDQLPALSHKAGTHSIQRLNIQLLLAPEIDKTHCRSTFRRHDRAMETR